MAEAEADQRAVEVAVADKERADLSRKSDAEILEQLHLKDPDTLQQGDDFAAFMRADVPQRLRRRALRTLWRSNPVLACLDDLAEYNEDFNAEWFAGGIIQTTYQVGKGMLAHVQEMERQKAAEEAEAAEMSDPAPAEVEEMSASTTPEIAEENGAPSKVLIPETDQGGEPTQDVADLPVLRRMRFEFDEA